MAYYYYKQNEELCIRERKGQGKEERRGIGRKGGRER